MSWWNDLKDDAIDYITGGRPSTEAYRNSVNQAAEDYSKNTAAAENAYNTEVSNAQKNRKSTKELMAEGKEYASAVSANKGGEAARQARAASMQGNKSRLMAAIQGASAASDASRQGYDEAASEGTSRATTQNENNINAMMQAAQHKYDSNMSAAKAKYDASNAAANAEKDRASDSRNRKSQIANTILSSFWS